MSIRPARRTIVGAGILASIALLSIALRRRDDADVPAWRAYSSHHLSALMAAEPCGESSPAPTAATRLRRLYHRLMARAWATAADARGEPPIVLGRRYRP